MAKKSKAIVVNIIGGPGSGKTIISSDIFSKLKRNYITSDISSEYIKRKLREQALKVIQSQIYIFGKQQFQLFTMKDDVKVIVTDSPILLSAIYDKTRCPFLKGLILKEYHTYDNMMYFLERDEKAVYETEGRYQDLKGAKIVDRRVKKFLKDNDIKYKTVKGLGQDTIDTIVKDVTAKLKKKYKTIGQTKINTIVKDVTAKLKKK